MQNSWNWVVWLRFSGDLYVGTSKESKTLFWLPSNKSNNSNRILCTTKYVSTTVAAAKYVTALDLANVYWQISNTEKAQRIAVFLRNFGICRPMKSPFGLKNAPHMLRKLVTGLRKVYETFGMPYIYDVIL